MNTDLPLPLQIIGGIFMLVFGGWLVWPLLKHLGDW